MNNGNLPSFPMSPRHQKTTSATNASDAETGQNTIDATSRPQVSFVAALWRLRKTLGVSNFAKVAFERTTKLDDVMEAVSHCKTTKRNNVTIN